MKQKVDIDAFLPKLLYSLDIYKKSSQNILLLAFYSSPRFLIFSILEDC